MELSLPEGSTDAVVGAKYTLYDSENKPLVTKEIVGAIFEEKARAPGEYHLLVTPILQSGSTSAPIAANVTIPGDYKTLSYSVSLERKNLRYYRTQNGDGTGIFRVKITGGAPPFTLKVLSTPPDFKLPLDWDRTISLGDSRDKSIYRFAEGQYKFQLIDNCSEGEIVTVDMENGELNPYAANAHAPSSITQAYKIVYAPFRTNNCQWIEQEVSFYQDNDGMMRYVADRDSLNKYFEIGLLYKKDAHDGTKTFDPIPSVANFTGSAIYTAEPCITPKAHGVNRQHTYSFYLKLPEGFHPFQLKGAAASYSPVLGVRERGDFAAAWRSWTGEPSKIDANPLLLERVRNTPCDTDYFLEFRLNSLREIPACLPITVTLVEMDAGAAVSGTEQSITISQDDNTTYRFTNKLTDNKVFHLTARTVQGAEYNTTLKAPDAHIVTKTGYEVAYCNVPRYGIDILLKGHELYKNFSGFKFKLVSAPEGYTPQENGAVIGRSYQIPETSATAIFPLRGQRATQSWRLLHIPSGVYHFELLDPCDRLYPLAITIPHRTRYSAGNKRLSPKIGKKECAKLRIYPFPEGIDNLAREDGSPSTNFELEILLPPGIERSETTVHYGLHSKEQGAKRIAVNKVGVSPKEIYLEVPEKSDKSYSFRFVRAKTNYFLDCIPRGTVTTTASALGYDRDSYIGYRCAGNKTGFIHIELINYAFDPITNKSKVTLELRHKESNAVLWSVSQVEVPSEGFEIPIDVVANTHWGANVEPSYILYLRDDVCGNSNNASDELYLDAFGSITTITDNHKNGRFCVGEELILTVRKIKGAGYQWIHPNGTVLGNEHTVKIPSLLQTDGGTYKVKITGVKCGATPIPTFDVEHDVLVASTEMWWSPTASDGNWNNPDNWHDKMGAPIHAVPSTCTHVHLPSVTSHSFPDLHPNVTKRDKFGDPVCLHVYFHFGSSLGQPQLLSYEQAYVDYNFGIMEGGSAKPYATPNHPTADNALLKRDRWYMVATPLKNLFSGDFGMGGKPYSFQRYLSVESNATSHPATIHFQKAVPDYLLNISRSMYGAFALRVAGSGTQPGYQLHTNLNLLQGIVRLPFYLDSSREKGYPLHKYNSATKVSRFLHYNSHTLTPISKSSAVQRQPEEDFRFIFESASTKKIGSIVVDGKSMVGYSLALGSFPSLPSPVLIGNPFMSPIDFERLYEVNKSILEPVYYIVENEEVKWYHKESPSTGSLSKVILPLQSFILIAKGSGNLLFPTDLNLSSVLTFGNSRETSSSGLRSTPPSGQAEADSKSVLPARGVLFSARLYGAPLVDSRKALLLLESSSRSVPALLFDEMPNNLAIPYVVHPSSKEACFVAATLPPLSGADIGVAGIREGRVTLRVENAGRNSFTKMLLLDKVTGKTIDLLTQPEYTYFSGSQDPSARFRLQTDYPGVIAGTEHADGATLHFSLESEGCRIAHSSGLEKIQLYAADGILLEEIHPQGAVDSLIPRERLSAGVSLFRIYTRDGELFVRKLILN